MTGALHPCAYCEREIVSRSDKAFCDDCTAVADRILDTHNEEEAEKLRQEHAEWVRTIANPPSI